METKFNISFAKLVNDVLPTGLRSASVLALARAAFVTIQTTINGKTDLWQRFAAARTADRFKLEHNGQVCYLRAALNKQFKSVQGVVFQISDVENDLSWLYASDEVQSEHIHALTESEMDNHIFAPNETVLDMQDTFIIYVPSDLYSTRLDQIKQFVNEYKLVTRKPQYEPI